MEPSLPYEFPESAIVTRTERDFIKLFAPGTVHEMIKDGSYESKLAAFLKTDNPPLEEDRVVIRELFRKSLKKSDVSRNNALILPKKEARKYFPDIARYANESITLRFLYRKTNRWLDLNYGYYSTWESYVLRTGWIQFAKDNKLKENDEIRFYECEMKEGEHKERYLMIDIVARDELEHEIVIAKETGNKQKGVKLFGAIIA